MAKAYFKSEGQDDKFREGRSNHGTAVQNAMPQGYSVIKSCQKIKTDEKKGAAWAKIRSYYQPKLGKGVTVQSLAYNRPWFASRSADSIDNFISLSWEELQCRRFLGKKKLDLLLQIFSDAMARDPQWSAADDSGEREASPPPIERPSLVSRLNRLGISATFPISLCRFSGRVKELCKTLHAETLGDLIRLVDRDGIAALSSHSKIGAKSLQQIQQFCESIDSENLVAIAEVLPYDLRRAQISLFQAARLILNSLGEQTRSIFTKRLLMGITLNAIGEDVKLTRERVRQLETSFLDDLAGYLEWFEDDRNVLFDKLNRHESIAVAFAELPAEDAAICAAAVEHLFHLSDEGKKLKKDYEALFESWVVELRKRVAFHRGQILLSTFLSETASEFLAKDFAAYGRRQRAFTFDSTTDIISPPSVAQKAVVAALLWEAQKDLEVELVLEALDKIEVRHFGSYQIQRSYDVWKTDPEFPPFEILFPRRALARPREVLAERSFVAPTYQPVAQPVKPPLSCSAELEECNSLVTEMVGRFATPTILGLLPFTSEEQSRIVRAVIDEHRNSVRKLQLLLELAPAAVAYSLAFAVGSEMVTNAFWESIERGLRIDIDSMARPGLSEDFRRAVHSLGLMEAGVRAGNHLWPILFQAGIVPQFVPQLAGNIGRLLEGRPPPDYEDEEELTRFTLAIRERVPKAWARLRELLDTGSGRRSCAAILQAHRADNFDLLPPHLRLEMRAAFKGVTRHFFATPYLIFQVNAGQVALCLPKQTRKLLTPVSCWQVGDTRTFPATETSIVPVDDFTAPTVTVQLKNLAYPVADWSREFSLFRRDTHPIQVFALPRGKEIRVDSNAIGPITLPFGEYAILVGVEAGSNIEEGWQKTSGEQQKWIEYSSFPGQVALEVVLDRTIRFIPRDEPAILVMPSRGGRIPTIDDEPIYFGEGLSVSLHIPANEIAQDNECRLLLIDGAGTLNESFTFAGASLLENPNLSLVEVAPHWIDECIGRLPCGIHQLTFGLSSNRRVIRRSIWFWKGFSHACGRLGFVCASPIFNVNFAASVGIRKHQDGIALSSSFAGTEIVLALNAPLVSLRLPSPGACITLQNPSTSECVPVALGRSLEFGPDDMSRLVVNINETLPCELLAGHTIIRTFEEGTGSFAQRIQTFFHEFGDATTLFCRVEGHTPERLLTITRLAIANGFVFSFNAGTKSYRGAFKLSKQYQQLSVVCQNLIGGQAQQSVELSLELGTAAVPLAFFGDLHFRVQVSEEDNYIEFFRDQDGMANGLFSLEFSCRKQSTDEWTALRVYEPKGVTGSRVFIVSEPLVAESSWWSELVCAVWQNHLNDIQALPELVGNCSEADLRVAFDQLNYALDYTYCGDAWNSIRWIRGVYDYLCVHPFRGHPALIAREAVHGLANKAKDTDALYRPLVFGSLEELWCSNGNVFGKMDYPTDSIGSGFEILSALSGCRGLAEFFLLPISRCVDIFALRYLDRSSKTFSYGRFFKDAATAVLEDEADSQEVILLSPHHLRLCIGNLRRNVDALLTVRDIEDSTLLGRRSAITSLLTFGNRLIVLEGFVKTRMAIPNAVAFDIDVYSPSPGPEIRRCILLLTALGRLCARGKVTKHEFHDQVRNVFGATERDPQSIQKGMTLLLCLAPELFSCAMLLWDIILFDQL